MPQDDKTNAAETPNTEHANDADGSDAFARAKTTGGAKKKKAARAPSVERTPAPPQNALTIDEDELPPMTAADAADVIVSMLDQCFQMACMIRGYDNVAVKQPDGTVIPLLAKLSEHDDAKKAMLKRDLARVFKMSGTTLSPGVALGVSGAICYALPIVSLEFTMWSAKREKSA